MAALHCLAEKDRNALLGSLAYQVERLVFFRTPKRDVAAELLKQHGLEGLDIMGGLQVADSPGGAGTA